MEEPKITLSTPHLANREAFERAIAHYQMSDHAKRVLAGTKLVLLNGPSSAGRNTIINFMVESGEYHFIVSDTTRPPRINNGVLEKSGREYWFRDEAEMLQDIEAGEFLEAEIIHGQQVSGISIRELQKASDENKIAINEVEIGGMLHVMGAKPDTTGLIILPPSFEKWQRRLTDRGEMNPAEFKRRMETAVRIFDEAAHGDRVYLIINDTVEHAAQLIDEAVKHGSHDTASQQQAKLLAKDLLVQTQALVAQL